MKLKASKRFKKLLEGSKDKKIETIDEAIKKVLQGSTDVAAISSINFEKWFKSNQKENKTLRVIYKSPPISGPPLVFARNLDPFLKNKIKSVVLDAHNHIDLGGYGGEMERYIDIETSQTKHLQSYIRPQWGLKTFALISFFVAVLSFFVVDLEINFL